MKTITEFTELGKPKKVTDLDELKKMNKVQLLDEMMKGTIKGGASCGAWEDFGGPGGPILTIGDTMG